MPKTALVTTTEREHGGCEATKVIEDLCGDALDTFFKEHPMKSADKDILRAQWKVEKRPHWMVMEASMREDVGAGVKSWHPPFAMRLLRGELMAFNYLHIFTNALIEVEKDLKTITSLTSSNLQILLSKYSAHLHTLQHGSEIPSHPLFCASWECKQKTRCYSHFGPLFGKDEQGHITSKANTFTLKSLMLGEPDHQWMLTYLPSYTKVDSNGYIDEKYVFMVRFHSVLFP